jgi:hypothetical protein
VTLTIDKTTINVGDIVTLFTKSRVLSQRPDFEAKRTLRYDFDGDGIRDLTTKDTTITHIYTKPYPK